jgi:hypothetical protein
MEKILLICLYLSILLSLLCGCDKIDISKITDQDMNRISQNLIVCNKPYMRYSSGCCLDVNNNSVCDLDEKTYSIDNKNKSPLKQYYHSEVYMDSELSNHSLIDSDAFTVYQLNDSSATWVMIQQRKIDTIDDRKNVNIIYIKESQDYSSAIMEIQYLKPQILVTYPEDSFIGNLVHNKTRIPVYVKFGKLNPGGELVSP